VKSYGRLLTPASSSPRIELRSVALRGSSAGETRRRYCMCLNATANAESLAAPAALSRFIQSSRVGPEGGTNRDGESSAPRVVGHLARRGVPSSWLGMLKRTCRGFGRRSTSSIGRSRPAPPRSDTSFNGPRSSGRLKGFVVVLHERAGFRRSADRRVERVRSRALRRGGGRTAS
jgi:hypothetical protein